MTYEDIRDKMEYHFTTDELLDAIMRWVGPWKMEEIFLDLAREWDIPLNED